MRWSLLRFPGTSFPKEALTGDPVLDRYLKEVDAHLIGGAKVRRTYLEKIKGELAKGGGSTALDAAGTPTALAFAQRKELARRLAVNVATHGCGFFAVLVLASTYRQNFQFAIYASLCASILFGLLEGWLTTFIRPRRDTNWPAWVTPSLVILVLVGYSLVSLGGAMGIPFFASLGLSEPKEVRIGAGALLCAWWIADDLMRRKRVTAWTRGTTA